MPTGEYGNKLNWILSEYQMGKLFQTYWPLKGKKLMRDSLSPIFVTQFSPLQGLLLREKKKYLLFQFDEISADWDVEIV